jgi:hypothetical protein
MDWFAPVTSATQWPAIQPGYGGLAGAEGTLASQLYPRKDAVAGTALVTRDAFLDAVLDRTATGGVWKIPEPGSSSGNSGILPIKSDWLTRAADSVKDRLDLSTGFPAVSDAYREALSRGTTSLLSSAVSGKALSDIYTRLARGTTASSLFSIWA